MKNEMAASGLSPNPFEQVNSDWHNIIRQFPKAGEKDKMDKQTEAIKNFFENLSGGMTAAKKQIGIEGVARILARTQRSGPGGRILCQGILDTTKTKDEMEKRAEANKKALHE